MKKSMFKKALIMVTAALTLAGSTAALADGNATGGKVDINCHIQLQSKKVTIPERHWGTAKTYKSDQTVMYISSKPITKVSISKKSVASTKTEKVKVGKKTIYVLVATGKKTGTTKIVSYTNKNKIEQKLTVEKYKSPFKSIKLVDSKGKVLEDLTSKFASSCVVNLSYKKYKNKKVYLDYTLRTKYQDNPWVYYRKNVSKAGQSQVAGTDVANGEIFKISKKGSGVVFNLHNTNQDLYPHYLVFK